MGVRNVRMGVVQAPRFFQLGNGIWDRSAKLSGFYRSGARHISATDLTQYLLADPIVRVFFRSHQRRLRPPFPSRAWLKQRVTRDGLDAQRQAATATLVGLQAQRATLVAERFRIEASAGPIQYLAVMVGAAPETAVRWLILLIVLCCDPAAIALTVAAASSRR
jgi:hypothetical protein